MRHRVNLTENERNKILSLYNKGVNKNFIFEDETTAATTTTTTTSKAPVQVPAKVTIRDVQNLLIQKGLGKAYGLNAATGVFDTNTVNAVMSGLSMAETSKLIKSVEFKPSDIKDTGAEFDDSTGQPKQETTGQAQAQAAGASVVQGATAGQPQAGAAPAAGQPQAGAAPAAGQPQAGAAPAAGQGKTETPQVVTNF